MRNKKLQGLVLLISIESAFALVLLLLRVGNPLPESLSTWNIVQFLVALILLTATFSSTWISIRSIRDPDWFDALCHPIEAKKLGETGWLLPLILTSALLLFMTLAVCLVFLFPQADVLGQWQVLYAKLRVFMGWVAVVNAEVLAFSLLSYSKVLRSKEFWQPLTIFRTLMLLGSILITFFHWGLLNFQVRIFKLIPGWFWRFHLKGIDMAIFYYLPCMAAALLIVIFILRKPGKSFRNLCLLAILGIGLQFTFGYLEGGGIESIRLKFAASMHKGYAEHACDRPDLFQALIHYEERYGKDSYLGTKPPGVLIVYVLTQKVSNLINPALNFNGRFLRMTTFMAYAYPLISMVVIFLIYGFARRYLDNETALWSSALYIFSPNVVLIPLFLDQVLYPLVFLTGVFLIGLAIRRQNVFLAFAAGAHCYIAMYFTFSMLPLIPLAIIWIALDYWQHRKERPLSKSAVLLAGLIIGIVVLLFLFSWLLNYDLILRYTSAFAKHKALKLYEPGIKNFFLSLLLNNVEFPAWSGFAVVLFALGSLGLSLAAFFRDRLQSFDVFTLAAFLTYAALNLFSQTRGEVGRIWLFMVPMVCIYAVRGIKELFPKHRQWVYGALILAQLVTTFLIFRFQDFFA